MSKAVADATNATEPVPTLKGPFVLPPGSWVSSDSILIKYSAAGVEQAARAFCPEPQEKRQREARGPHPSWNGEQELGREPWAGGCVLVSIWLMFGAQEFTLQDANLPWVSR